MNLSETCIRRPVLTTLVTASIIVLGIFAYRLLSVAALPAVDFPTISITGHAAGRERGNNGGIGSAPDRTPALPPSPASPSLTVLVVARHHLRSPSSSTSTATSTAPRWMCRRALRGAAAPAVGNDDAAELPKG
jgi:hypothetical protein